MLDTQAHLILPIKLKLTRSTQCYNIVSTMIQKIIRVGNSVAVVIPKKVLEEKRIKVGDSVNVSVNPIFTVDREIHDLTQKLIKQYRPALEELASK